MSIDYIEERKIPMKMFMNAFKKNASCIIETAYLYILFLLVELQTTTGNAIKLK